MIKTITDCYYPAYNKKELESLFKQLLEDNNDSLKEKRIQTIKEMKFLEEKTSQRILKYIRSIIK